MVGKDLKRKQEFLAGFWMGLAVFGVLALILFAILWL